MMNFNWGFEIINDKFRILTRKAFKLITSSSSASVTSSAHPNVGALRKGRRKLSLINRDLVEEASKMLTYHLEPDRVLPPCLLLKKFINWPIIPDSESSLSSPPGAWAKLAWQSAKAIKAMRINFCMLNCWAWTELWIGLKVQLNL